MDKGNGSGGYTEGNLDGQTKTGNADLFVTKYDLAGTKNWTTLVGGPGATAGIWGGGILTDSFNTVYAGGYTTGNAGSQVNPYAPYSAFLISRFSR
jgi:hypothetical protein